MSSKKPEKSRSSSRWVLYASFSGILLVMAATWLIGLRQLDSLSQVIKEQTLHSEKMELVSILIELARTRTRLTNNMTLLDDVFERDEINLELDKKAAEFARLRQQLLSYELTPMEKQLLDEQSRIIANALTIQRRAAELAMSDEEEDLARAREMLMNDVYPRQGEIIDKFMAILSLNKTALDTSAENSIDDIRRYSNFDQLGYLMIAIAYIWVAIFVVNRIQRTENDLDQEKEKAEVTFRSIGDAIITTDASGYVEYVNEKAEQLIGLFASQAIHKHVGEVFLAYDVDNKRHVTDFVNQYLSGNSHDQMSSNVDLTSTDGKVYHISASISPIMEMGGRVNGMVITFHDVTKSRELMRRIEFQATHDALTGLLNRREFERKVKQALSLYERDTNHAFCIVDLDRFKIVNDACGHQAGDELLRQLADQMKTVMRKGDLIARIGGDEFAIFLSNINTDQASNVANELLGMISQYRFYWDDKTFRVGASIGLVDASPELSDYEFLYHSADTACYIAKNEGRNRIHVMSIEDAVLAKKKEETDWLARLNKALDEDGFYLFGQSIIPISLRAEGRQHVEILIRMISDDRRVISPMAFIPTAERYGLMQRIDLYVVEQICRYINDRPLDYAVYAINLSGQTLSSVAAMQRLIDLVKKSEIPSGRLCLEVTETVAIANLENARSFMHTMQDLGCYTALDDFGSGLSSFSYLKNLPLDYIKIDGIFVNNMTEDKSSAIMVDAIHSIGKKLGLMTIAEYVENEETVNMLREIGVDLAQGYYYSEPELFVPPFYATNHTGGS